MDIMTVVKTALQADEEPTVGLRALGLAATKSVYQADTLETPPNKPFIVIRWLDVEPGVGDSKIHPFLIWVYDEAGDYARPKAIAKRAATVLLAVPQTAVDGGMLAQFIDRRMGAELADPGWQANVIPYNMAAVGHRL